MPYFAGLFDAEGCISLCHNGAFNIAIEITNEEIPNLFKDRFQGSIYTRKRDNRKKTWIWKINSISEQALNFINHVSQYSVAKKPQLELLKTYLDRPRDHRKEIRNDAVKSMKQFKSPLPLPLNDIFTPTILQPNANFFHWLSGFIDGDGNIVCNEYIDKRSGIKYFAHQICAFNTFPNVIRYIKQHIDGNIRTTKATLFPIYRWTCKRSIEKYVCEAIYPFLKIKKNQCRLFMEFINFPKKQRGIPYPIEDRDRMYAIINQIKHLNSL